MTDKVKARYIVHAAKASQPNAIYELHSYTERLEECLKDVFVRMKVEDQSELASLIVTEIRSNGSYKKIYTKGVSQVLSLPAPASVPVVEGVVTTKYRVLLWQTAQSVAPVIHLIHATAAYRAAEIAAKMYDIHRYTDCHAILVYDGDINDKPVLRWGATAPTTVSDAVKESQQGVGDKSVPTKRYILAKG